MKNHKTPKDNIENQDDPRYGSQHASVQSPGDKAWIQSWKSSGSDPDQRVSLN